MIVDTHVHVISDDRVAHPLASDAGGWAAQGVLNPIDEYMRLMQEAGVDRVLLVQPAAAYGFDNSYHADSAARYAGRAAGVGLLSPVAPESAERLEYWVKERGMQGVRISLGQTDADDPRANALWEQAGKLGVPIMIGGGGQPDRIEKIRNMAARFPHVIAMPDHMAGWSGATEQRAAVTEALVHLASLPNMHMKISSTTLGPFSTLTQEEQDLFRRVLDAFTPQRMLWGSNYPASREGGYAAQAELGRTALPWLSESDRNWMLGETALKLWPRLRGSAA